MMNFDIQNMGERHTPAFMKLMLPPRQSLRDQVRRKSSGIGGNIAEGYDSRNNPTFCGFLIQSVLNNCA